jgi:glycosyltransferase involved in cell wall biosynthesis
MVIARSLVAALRDAGHDAEVVVTPQNRFGRQAAAYFATWLTDVGSSEGRPIDRVISLRYPSYAVRHPHHVCWLNHTMREYYDLWDRFQSGLGARAQVKESIRRRLVRSADWYFLKYNVRQLFVQSRTVQQRLWPSLQSRVLYPPAPQRPYRCDGYGNYIFMVSRLTSLKRVDLLLRALAMPAGAGIQAVIAGEGEERPALEALIAREKLSDRVTLTGRLDDAELLEHLARCRAVCFPPFNEDFGFVTVEAFAAQKPVITCSDSGGPAELVADGEHGLVTEPTAGALADALRRIMRDQSLAERLGRQAHARGAELTWARTVETLLAVN